MPRALRLASRLLALALALGFALSVAWLASFNASPGSPDSRNNLATARNIAEGRGYESDLVVQFFFPQELPGPEILRFPGLPYLMAGVYRLAGPSMGAHVVVNGAITLLTALLLWLAFVRLGSPLVADLSLALVLLAPTYELVSLWNNGALCLACAGLILLAVEHARGTLAPGTIHALAGLVLGLAFLAKGSALVGAALVPLALAFGVRAPRREGAGALRRLADAGLSWALFLAAGAPLWIRNLWLFGDPLHSPLPAVRLAERYGGFNGFGILDDGSWWSIRFGEPLGYAEVIERIGVSGMIGKDAESLARSLEILFGFNSLVVGLALLGLVLAWRTQRRLLLVAAALLVEPVFAAGVYLTWDQRYLWPAYLVLVFVAGLGLARLFRDAPAGRWMPAARALALALVALALAGGVERARGAWGRFEREARTPEPSWVKTLTTESAAGEVVMSDDPWSVAWYARRPALLTATGPREDFERVLDLYQPAYLLVVGRERGQAPPPFRAGELELIQEGGGPRGWSLYALRRGAPL